MVHLSSSHMASSASISACSSYESNVFSLLLVRDIIVQVVRDAAQDRARLKSIGSAGGDVKMLSNKLLEAACVFEQIVTSRQFIDFRTTYLYSTCGFSMGQYSFKIKSLL